MEYFRAIGVINHYKIKMVIIIHNDHEVVSNQKN